MNDRYVLELFAYEPQCSVASHSSGTASLNYSDFQFDAFSSEMSTDQLDCSGTQAMFPDAMFTDAMFTDAMFPDSMITNALPPTSPLDMVSDLSDGLMKRL